MDTEESGYVDPADQWVLDPATGRYELRLEPPAAERPAPEPPAPAPTTAPAPPARRGHGSGGRRAAPSPAAAGSRRRKAKPKAKRPSAAVLAAVGTGLVLVVGGTASVMALHGGGGGASVHAVDVGGAAAKTLASTGPMNVLVLGGDPANGTADTAVLLHLAADRGNATALGIPPNLLTDIPDCPSGGGKAVVKGAAGQPFAAALTGGRDAGCALRVVEQMTGLPVDHVLSVDYPAVKASSVAAADLCVDRTLAAPATLAALARTAPGALTADPALASADAVGRLADALGGIDGKHVTFVALPVTAKGESAVLDRAKATQVFSMVKHDVSVSRGTVPPDPKLVGPKATPHNTRVLVYNGTGVFGASQDVLAWLQNEQGVNRSTNGGDARARASRTTLAYAPNQADQARSLAAMMGLPASALVPGTKDAAPRANMTLVLGADYTAPGVPIGPPAALPKGVRTTAAAAVTCPAAASGTL